MNDYFSYDKRLGIKVPTLQVEWEDYSEATQQIILFYWEEIRGSIPDRITFLEDMINLKQAQLDDESDFNRSCRLNSEIAELASIINDLWLLYRADQEITIMHH